MTFKFATRKTLTTIPLTHSSLVKKTENMVRPTIDDTVWAIELQ